MAFLGRYGWNRVQLYFLSASKRPTWGYVDFPPLTAWLAWGVRQLAGDSLVALRLTLSRCGGGDDVLRRSDRSRVGRRRVRAAGGGVCLVALPVCAWLGERLPSDLARCARVVGGRLSRGADPRAAGAASLAAARPCRGDRARGRTMAFLLAGLGLALLLFDRRLLRTGGPWVALAIAVALLVPNLVWQAQHGWPSVAFASSQNAKSAADTPPPTYVIEQVLFLAGVFILVRGRCCLVVAKRLRGARGVAGDPVRGLSRGASSRLFACPPTSSRPRQVVWRSDRYRSRGVRWR